MRRMLAALFAVALLLAPGAVAHADNGLRIEGQTNYDVQAGSGAVKVTATINLQNTTVDTPQGTTIRRLFFSSLSVPVPAEATNVTATSEGAPLTVSTATINQFVSQATISFPNIFAGQSRAVTLTYDIATGRPRTDGVVRINPSYASFLAFAFGDAGLASVKITVPGSFQTEIVGSPMAAGKAGDANTYTSVAITDVNSFGVVVSARNDAALTSRDADVGARDLLVRSWPNDAEWAAFAFKTITEGVPLLEELIGQPWPIKGQLTVIEAVTPYLRGYSGWFSPSTNTIEIGERLDTESMLHELAHAWFNRELFSDRWINEAFAEEYARQAMTRLGGKAEAVTAPRANDVARFKISGWSAPTGRPQDAVATESYGYQASEWVLSELVREIGAAKLARVIDAAAADTPAFGGAPGSFGDLKTDSRRFLDLLETVGGSAKASELFAAYVLTDRDIALLPKRSMLKSEVAALGAGEWGLPSGVLQSMGQWNFEAVDAMLPAARRVVALGTEIATALEPLGLQAPAILKDTYARAGSVDDLLGAEELGRRQLASVGRLSAARAALDRDRGFVDTIGLLWSSPSRRFDDAAAAFDAGRPDDAEAAADEVIAQLDGATAAGYVRLAGAGAVLVGGSGVAALARVRRRRRRPAVALDDAPAAPKQAEAVVPAAALPEWPLPEPQPPIAPPPSPWTPVTGELVEGDGDERFELLWPPNGRAMDRGDQSV